MKVRIDALEQFLADTDKAVKQRLREWPEDPIARGMSLVAIGLSNVLEQVKQESLQLTVEQYAEERGVTPQTVRRWIRNNQLQAEETPHGWRIPVEAEPVDEVKQSA